MNDFIDVIKKDPQIHSKINEMLDRYMRLRYRYRSKIGYDCLIQIVILKELITDLDVELKIKSSRIKNLGDYFDHVILFNINDDYICNGK